MSSQPEQELVRGLEGRLFERRLFPNVKGIIIRSGTLILLDDEDKLDTSVQTALEHGGDISIKGGFCGINAQAAAIEYSDFHLRRQLEQDHARFVLDREKFALKREHRQAQLGIERLRAQNNAPSAWPNGANTQYMNPNPYPGFMSNHTFHGQPRKFHKAPPRAQPRRQIRPAQPFMQSEMSKDLFSELSQRNAP